MGQVSDNYQDRLRAELTRRQNVNQRYSLRTFAKTIGLSPAFLSKVLRGNLDLSPERAVDVAERLGYSAGETAQFCQLVQMNRMSSPKLSHVFAATSAEAADAAGFVPVALDAFQTVSDWYHYALLELSQCKDFSSEPSFIAHALGISEKEAAGALTRLVRVGLMKRIRGKYVKTNQYLATPTDKPSQAVRNFHAQMIQKAQHALQAQAVEQRDITGITIAINSEKMSLAKNEIRKFRRKMAKLLDSSKPTEVYQLNVQFFKLTQTGVNK